MNNSISWSDEIILSICFQENAILIQENDQ